MTSTEYQILLSLVPGSAHGYAIMGDIEERTDGAFAIGPGSLYRSLHRMLRDGLLEEIADLGGRRREYQLTPAGRAALRGEAERLRDWAAAAIDRGVLEP